MRELRCGYGGLLAAFAFALRKASHLSSDDMSEIGSAGGDASAASVVSDRAA